MHEGWRQPWLNWPFHVLSDCGLSHAQITALLAVAFRRRLHWGWILGFSLIVMAGSAAYEVNRYGKPPTVALAYLLCLALFWQLPPRTAGWAAGAGVVTGLLRLLWVRPISRQRPSNLWFSQPLEPIFGATSFPSGHTTTSFAIAVFIAWAVRRTDHQWLGPAALLWASLIGFSRIYVGVHYPLDIVGGAALGVAGGSLAWMIAERWGGFSSEEPSQPAP